MSDLLSQQFAKYQLENAKMKNDIEIKGNENTHGVFNTEIIGGLRPLYHDLLSFDKNDQHIQIFAYEGSGGGVMRPRRYLVFEFASDTPSGNYDIKDILKAELLAYSDSYNWTYIPESGWISIILSESSPRVRGLFTMNMKNIGESTGPAHIEVSGDFNLSNE
ncbi:MULTISPECIES: hypothetical protein [Pseudomonas]|nr:hypothetical protein [Pseudomonas koreensis]